MQNANAYIWNFISRFGSQVLWLITSMILARFISPDDFGVIGVLSVIFMVANTLTESGLGGALIIKKEIEDEDCGTIFIFNIVVSHILYIIIFLLSDEIETFYHVENLSKVAKILSLVFLINSWGLVPNTLLNYNLKFKALCLINLSGIIVSAIIAVLMAFLNFGLYALIAYQLIQALLRTIGTIIVSKYKFPLFFKWEKFKSFFSFGFFTTMSGIIDTIYENLLSIIYGKAFNMAQAGYLSQAKKIEEASTQSLLATVNNTSFPLLAKVANDKEAFCNESYKILNTIPCLLFPLLMCIAVYAKEVIFILFGNNWIEASYYLSILVFAGLFLILDSITRNFVKSLGYVKILFEYTMAKRIIGLVVICICGIINYNLIIYGYVISSAIGCTLNIYAFSKCIKESFLRWIYLSFKPLLPTLLLTILIYITYRYYHLLAVSIAITVIILSIYYIWILPLMGINTKNILFGIFAKVFPKKWVYRNSN